MGLTGPYKALQCFIGPHFTSPYWSLLSGRVSKGSLFGAGPYWALRGGAFEGLTGPFKALQEGLAKPYSAFQGLIKPYKALQDLTVPYCALLGGLLHLLTN